MKTVYMSIMNRLASEIPALSWIELNISQLKLIEKGELLPITYPCALIGISMPECIDITERTQDCRLAVEITLLFDPIEVGQTAANASEEDRNNALRPYDIISDVYKTLQGFGTDQFNALSRISEGREYSEILYVYKINFLSDFVDTTAE